MTVLPTIGNPARAKVPDRTHVFRKDTEHTFAGRRAQRDSRRWGLRRGAGYTTKAKRR